MKLNKSMKALTLAGALAVMIPLSAYAATYSSSTTTAEHSAASGSTLTIHKGKALAPRDGSEGFRRGMVGQEVLDLLKLDAKTLKERLAAGKTLAQIAEEQGVSRDALKQAMTAAFEKRQAKEKQAFDENLDKTLDGQHPLGGAGGKGGFKAGFGKLDLEASAKLLGVTTDALKQELADGKSLADVAKEKGVDVQKLIDAQKQAIVDGLNAAVKAGKLTQEQADKISAEVGSIAEKIVNGAMPQVKREGWSTPLKKSAESGGAAGTDAGSAAEGA
ncbi:hypothetical protein SAMN02799624_04630 [Paenibacillus sp. UNC496MF]|uniref:hypothetical protein n=1 Tax=Paenibacillus sp. UNC496MF TaxID=1502753 RepID=UPI0008EFFBEF|nr:hypothetical protein [Paenibacillus sp. UNC496MF]SFJ45689.1 hypothetical protein SAMN02799624_04630 [Paenibacillus sp. UNC496MF]